MFLPREIWIRILEIKSHTAWMNRLEQIHERLCPCLVTETYHRVSPYPPLTRTTFHSCKSVFLEIYETLNSTVILRYITIEGNFNNSKIKLWILTPIVFDISFRRRDPIYFNP